MKEKDKKEAKINKSIEMKRNRGNPRPKLK